MAKNTVRKTLPRADWDKVFGTTDIGTPTGRRDRAMYYFAYFTGIRVGELVNLRTDDVNLKRGSFTTPPEGKTGQRKLGIPDSKMLYDLLNAWLGTKDEWGCADSRYFFCSRSGKRLSEDNFYTTLKRRGAKVGLKVSPHMMRHSYATERIHEKADILTLMSELGHRQVKTTLVYLHQENSRAIESMQRRAL